MKKLGLAVLGAGILSVLAGFLVLQVFPGTALLAFQTLTARSAGFESRSVELDGYTAHYYVGGPDHGSVVVLLHGLIDDRNSFVLAAKELSETHRVILPDLQGHGDNAQVPGRDYSIRGQVDFLTELLEALDVDELIIGGNSMGGHVAAAFALSHEVRVEKLILLNATGMLLDAPPTYYSYPDDIDVAYMDEMYSNAFIRPPTIPRPIMRHLAEDLNAKAPFYNALVEQVIEGEDFRLDDRIDTLVTPTLVIWGTEDRLVGLQYAEAYHAGLLESDLQVLEAGHAPQIEIPDAVSASMLAFIDAD